MDTSPDRYAVEWCEIRRWRGYARSTFYAITEHGDVLAESKPFRWSDPSPQTAAAMAAYASVVEAIGADGWTVADEEGPSWYERRFTRPRRAPLVEPPPLPAPPAPAAPVVPTPSPREPAATPAAPGPQPPPAALPARAPAPAQPKKRKGVLVGVAAALVAVGAAAAVPSVLLSATGSHTVGPHAPAPRLDRDRVVPAKHGRGRDAERRKPTPPHRRPLVDVRIVAFGNGSWLEVRRRSAGGQLLYEATLPTGGRLHFRGARLWARFGAAGNLSITVDGRPVALTGTQEKVFAP